MERHCNKHGNYGFFLGSSGGCLSCKSDRADMQRAREDAKRDRERSREEAQSRHRENQRNREEANRDRERAREEAQSRHRENNQRREERQRREPQQTYRQPPRFVDESSRMELSRQLEAARVEKDHNEKAKQERLAEVEKERLVQEAKAEQERLVREEAAKKERRIQETVALERKLKDLIRPALGKAEDLVAAYGVVNTECAEIIARWRKNLVTGGTSVMASIDYYERVLARDLQIIIEAYSRRAEQIDKENREEQERCEAKQWLTEHPQAQQQYYPPCVVKEIKRAKQEELREAQVEYDRREFHEECVRKGARYAEKAERIRRNKKMEEVFEIIICIAVFFLGSIFVAIACGLISPYTPDMNIFALFARYHVMLWVIFVFISLITIITCKVLGNVKERLFNDEYH